MLFSKTLIFCSFLVLFFSGLIFSKLVFSGLGDYIAHIDLSVMMEEGRIPTPANFLPYLIINISKNYFYKKLTLIALISISTTLKFVVTYIYINHFLPKSSTFKKTILSICMLFIFAIPNLKLITNHLYYVGNFTSNVWHNTTIIFLMPFALLLYYSIFIKPQNVLVVTLLIIVNIIIKPSFIFILIPLLFLLQIFDVKEKKLKFNFYWRYFLYGGISIILIFIQYLLLFEIKNSTDNKVVLDFFPFCKDYFDYLNIIVTIFCSYLFPLLLMIYFIINKINFTKYQIHTFIFVFFALIINFSFVETGSRRFHGNFSWQIIPASYLLMLFTTISYIKNYKLIKPRYRIFLNFAFLLHCIYGLMYLLRILLYNKYE